MRYADFSNDSKSDNKKEGCCKKEPQYPSFLNFFWRKNSEILTEKRKTGKNYKEQLDKGYKITKND